MVDKKVRYGSYITYGDNIVHNVYDIPCRQRGEDDKQCFKPDYHSLDICRHAPACKRVDDFGSCCLRRD